MSSTLPGAKPCPGQRLSAAVVQPKTGEVAVRHWPVDAGMKSADERPTATGISLSKISICLQPRSSLSVVIVLHISRYRPVNTEWLRRLVSHPRWPMSPESDLPAAREQSARLVPCWCMPA
jgi:hypothetical protein